MKLFSRAMSYVAKCVDVEYQIRDEKFLQEQGGAIIIGNHQSSLDTLALCHIWNAVKYAITVIIKKELFYALPFGPSAYLAGVIFINRNNSRSAYKELQEIKERMVNQKVKIWFFPEGTRNEEYTKLLPFKKGAFNLAVEAQVPIIPVVMSPYYFVNNKKCIFNKGHVVIQCLEPVPTAGLTRDDVPALIKICYDKMTVACKELSKEIFDTNL
ncbi:unnamed protein product [Arctia plantaginis]|uniref:1-acyl-sn-glycerol-3-phosphate acyltransferase n=1 Tax=Arctia plantaginis TaxID=874455 RepID=A0A8S1A2G4_ARCPL|nr:unnamed protein product [Arctia plantaginis]CAB3238593.1 unnamed protein product [Arctia plantaginis]